MSILNINDMIDFSDITNKVLAGLFLLIIGGIARHFYTQRKEKQQLLSTQRKEQWERRLPILRELLNLLKELEKVGYFDAKRGPADILKQNTIERNEGSNKTDRKLNCIHGAGPLSWAQDEDVRSKIRDLLRDRFTPDVDLDHIKAKLGKIMDLLDDFAIRLSEFNKRWPGGESVEALEQKNKSKILDEIQTVEHKAALIRKCVIELKTEIDNAMRPPRF